MWSTVTDLFTSSSSSLHSSSRSADHHRRISFAYANIIEPPQRVLVQYAQELQELDLSHNKISDVKWLQCVPSLRCLILDGNHLTSHLHMPLMSDLQTLWVNHNRISNLSTFILTLAKQAPSLRYLSMMNNPAAPSYFNGGSFKQYQDYRQYVISQLRELDWLDDKAVSGEERREAERVYRRVILHRRG